MGEPERVTEERKSLNATLDTMKRAIKVLQRDPDITNTAFGEDELEEQLRMESMNKRRDEEQKRRPAMAGGPDGGAGPGGPYRGPDPQASPGLGG